jgi:hypothetical protein
MRSSRVVSASECESVLAHALADQRGIVALTCETCEHHDVVAGRMGNALDQRGEPFEGVTHFVFITVAVVPAAHAAKGG